MKDGNFGRIILIASRASTGAATRTAYSATKSGMSAWRAPGRWKPQLTASPSIWWRRDQSRPTCSTSHSARQSESGPARPLDSGRAHRRPGDVARAVMFFASPDADFITGQSLYVLRRREHRIARALMLYWRVAAPVLLARGSLAASQHENCMEQCPANSEHGHDLINLDIRCCAR